LKEARFFQLYENIKEAIASYSKITAALIYYSTSLAYDNICRYLTTEYASTFAGWLLNINTPSISLLPTELKLDPVCSDVLYFLPDYQQILHLEFQTIHTSVPALPLRMLDYWLRLYRQYECSIEQVVIFLKQTNSDAVYVEHLGARSHFFTTKSRVTCSSSFSTDKHS
jgi:hypothetical protein